MEYSLINKDTLEFIKKKEFGDLTPPVFVQPAKPWVWVPFTYIPLASFDETIEVRDGVDEVIDLTQHTVTELKRLKTQAELNQDIEASKDAQMLTMDELGVILKVVHNHENRLRTLEGKPSVTLEQVRNFLRGLL